LHCVRLLIMLIIAAGCSRAEQAEELRFEVSGRLEDSKIREASGLARSHNQPNLMWIINDHGAKEFLHAIDHSGAKLGRFKLKKSKNKDWEDLASFKFNDEAYLMVADIGDNDAKRAHRTLYFVQEPGLEQEPEVTTDWKVRYQYPNGPRDAESSAIDTRKQQVLILSKRDLPPQLFSVPLQSESETMITAEKLGVITSLPRPSRQDVEYAAKTKDRYWRPVGMDISEDNLAAVILTYRAVFYFERATEQSWIEALNAEPVRISLGNFKNAEAIAFGDDKRVVFVTGENKHSRLLRIDLGER